MVASSNAQLVLLVTTPSGANEHENLTGIDVVVNARRQRQRPQQPSSNLSFEFSETQEPSVAYKLKY